MRSQGWWVDWDQEDPIRQGDIVRALPVDGGPVRWGLIVTADCDIVQGKSGERFTWLSVVPAIGYLRDRWAPDQLRRLLAKQARPTAEALSGQLRRRDADLDPLSEASLCRWLATHEPAAIWDAVAPGKPADARLVRSMTAVRIAAGHVGPVDPLERLQAAWTALGRDDASQRALVSEAFEGDRGFPDFFLLPDLPGGDGIGHVVLLREIASIDAGEVFGAERDARLADRPDAFHRIARLEDGLRFAVTQKLAFLFSRIGLPSEFERACTAATELVVEGAGFGDQP